MSNTTSTTSTSSEVPLDSCVRAVIDSFKARAAIGKAKYGTDLDRKDLSVLDWIQHAQEEHMDAILYLEKLKQMYREKEANCVKGIGPEASDKSTNPESFKNYWGC